MAQEDFNEFAKRVEQAESRGRRYGKDGKLLTSPKGAQGEMQVMPGTQTDPGFGVTPAKPGDDADIARVGKDYLAAMEKRYGGNREYAAVAYNWGPGNADKWIAKGADFSKLPAETQAYVQSVTGGVSAPSATAQASPKEVTPKTTPAADMGTGYQAALALSFLNDQEDDDEKAVAKLEEEQDSESAKMLAEHKPFNALAGLDLTSAAQPQAFKDGGDVGMTQGQFEAMLRPEPTMMERASDMIQGGARRALDSMFPIRRMVRTGAEPLAEEWMLNHMKQDPNAVLNNMDYTSNHAAAANFHIKNALRKAVGLEPFQDNRLREIPDVEVDSFPPTQSGLPPIKRADGSPEQGEVPTPMLFSVPTYAETVSHEMYPGQGGQFDQKDAARHMLAAGTLARKYGENAAEMLGNLHEIKTSPLRWVGSKLGISQMPVDYEQDLHNNRVGIELAKRSKSQKDLEDLINMEAERARSQQTPGAAWIGKPVKRAGGSPEGGEQALTPEEIEAASKPAFLTPKSGLRRQISTKPGQIEGAFAQGVSETPYNLVGAPVDIATMAMRPFGYSVQNPVMGSEWIKEKMSDAGVRPQPPTSPTERAFYEAGQLGGGAINPAAPVRGTIAAAQKTGEAAKMLAKDIQQYNQQLAVPGASYAVRPRGGPLLNTDTKPGLSWQTANSESNLAPGVVDPITPIMFDLAGLPDKPLKEWFRSKVGAYMRRDMGSPDDQFVKAAEEGKRLHFLQKPNKDYTQEQLKKDVGYSTPFYRKGEGFNPEGEAQTMYGKMVEGRVDLPLEPTRAGDLLGTPEERLIPPSMLAAAKADPEMRFYGLDNIIVNNLKLEDLRDYMYKMRNTHPEFSAYGQPNVQVPERYRFTDEALKGLTPAQASERVAQAENWFQDTKQKMASAAVNENKQLISHEYKNGSKWASFPDLAEHDDMLKLVQDVGCDGKWCTKGENYALRYGSEDGKRLNVLFDSKSRPKAQITLQEKAGTPNDFIGTITGKEYDNFMNRHPHISQVIEDDRPMSPFAFENMLDDVAQTPEYRSWLASQSAKITEIKGVANSTDLENAPFVGEIQDFVKRMDKQHRLQSVENLDGIGMSDLATAGNPATIIGSAISEEGGSRLTHQLRSRIIERIQALNGDSAYVVTKDVPELVKKAVREVMDGEGHATGGMIERRTDHSSRYL